MITGSQRFPGKGNENLLQDSCLENSMDRGLQSMGSQKVRHDLDSEQQQLYTQTHISGRVFITLLSNEFFSAKL